MEYLFDGLHLKEGVGLKVEGCLRIKVENHYALIGRWLHWTEYLVACSVARLQLLPPSTC